MASIRKHAWADGRTVTIKVLWREDGRQTSASFTEERSALIFKTYLENAGPSAAWEWLAKANAATEPPEMVTLDVHVEHYITHLTGIEDGTRAEYRRMYARTWSRNPDGTPFLGNLPVDAIDRDSVAAAVNALDARGLAAKSIANAHGLLYAAMDAAVEAELIGKNPCRRIRLPRADDGEDDDVTYLEHAEFAAILEHVPVYWQPLVWTLAMTGVRWGEATALRVRDVSIPKRTVRVARAWKRVDGGWRLGPPKTKKGRRTVDLAPELVALLVPLVKGRHPDDWLFTSRRGDTHVHHSNFRERVWIPALDRAKLHKRPRIHDLRHTHVSWLIAQGVPLPAIQRRLGHESIQTTVDTYGDLIPDLQREAAAASSGAFAAITRPQLQPGGHVDQAEAETDSRVE
jgi:integrase